jgi:hypothetical protein
MYGAAVTHRTTGLFHFGALTAEQSEETRRSVDVAVFDVSVYFEGRLFQNDYLGCDDYVATV